MIAVIGPTASGKSDLALRLALWLRSGRIEKQFGVKGAEIISADSRQVYKGMDIGTGKVTKKEQGLVRHHLLDVANPKKVFTVSDFKKLGGKAIDDIVSHHKLPIIVGGTAFYVDALLKDLHLPEVPPNKKLRAHLDKLGIELLFEKLKKLDPERAGNIDPKNKRRIIRALEIIEARGKVPPLDTNYSLLTTNYNVLWLGIRPKDLNIKIEKRLDIRLKQGMVREVINLHNPPAGGGVSWRRLDDFGLEYRWISRWLKNHKNNKSDLFSNSQEYENLLRNIIKYSKRQMTWFKRNKKIHWINPPAGGRREAEKIIRKFLASHP